MWPSGCEDNKNVARKLPISVWKKTNEAFIFWCGIEIEIRKITQHDLFKH